MAGETKKDPSKMSLGEVVEEMVNMKAKYSVGIEFFKIAAEYNPKEYDDKARKEIDEEFEQKLKPYRERLNKLEAQINEWISVAAQLKDDDESSFWRNLESMQKSLKIDEKWNLIASYQNSNLWDNSKEPFQSYQTITENKA